MNENITFRQLCLKAVAILEQEFRSNQTPSLHTWLNKVLVESGNKLWVWCLDNTYVCVWGEGGGIDLHTWFIFNTRMHVQQNL